MVHWGFLVTDAADLGTTPDIALFVSEGEAYSGVYWCHYNLIVVDSGWLGMMLERLGTPIQRLARTFSHEMTHYVLDKLFPGSSVSCQLDNVAETFDDWSDGLS